MLYNSKVIFFKSENNLTWEKFKFYCFNFILFEKVDKTEESNNVCNFLTSLTVCYEGCQRV